MSLNGSKYIYVSVGKSVPVMNTVQYLHSLFIDTLRWYWKLLYLLLTATIYLLSLEDLIFISFLIVITDDIAVEYCNEF